MTEERKTVIHLTETRDAITQDVETKPIKSEQPPLVMPGPREQVAEEVASIGVEGRPADAKAGPGMLWMELKIVGLIVLAISIIIGWWMGWAVGLAVLAISWLMLLFNPVVGATLNRAHDRKVVAKRHLHHP